MTATRRIAAILVADVVGSVRAATVARSGPDVGPTP